MIRFEFNGKPLRLGDLEQAIVKAAMEEIAVHVKAQIGSIRHPESGEFPTIVVMGDSLENLSCKVEGSPEMLALVKERLGDDDEITLVQTPPSHQEPTLAFLSYGGEDRELAEKIAKALRGKGIDTWLDKWCIRSGDSLRQKIDEGLGKCTHFIVLLTPTSLTKPWVNQEMDAGLVRKIRDQCRFIPLRHDLAAENLPPLLSGIFSPDLSDFEAGLKQLINDIHGVALSPPLGAPPETVAQSVETKTGYSVAASTVAKLFVETTEHATFGDPQLTISEIMGKTELSEEDVEDALYELCEMVKVSHDRVLVKDELFATFDKFWKPWNSAEDALKIAADLVNNEDFPRSPKEIAERYEWDPRRINPAAAYLINRDVVIGSKAIGTAPWLVVRIEPKDGATRRFVRSQSL